MTPRLHTTPDERYAAMQQHPRHHLLSRMARDIDILTAIVPVQAGPAEIDRLREALRAKRAECERIIAIADKLRAERRMDEVIRIHTDVYG